MNDAVGAVAIDDGAVRAGTVNGERISNVEIAECGGRICGHLFLQMIDKMPNPDPREPEHLAYLTSFFVEPDLRDRGVGAALMQQLEAFAQRSDVEKILIVGTTPRSRSLYARRGYQSAPDLLQKIVM